MRSRELLLYTTQSEARRCGLTGSRSLKLYTTHARLLVVVDSQPIRAVDVGPFRIRSLRDCGIKDVSSAICITFLAHKNPPMQAYVDVF